LREPLTRGSPLPTSCTTGLLIKPAPRRRCLRPFTGMRRGSRWLSSVAVGVSRGTARWRIAGQRRSEAPRRGSACLPRSGICRNP